MRRVIIFLTALPFIRGWSTSSDRLEQSAARGARRRARTVHSH